jgi:hypothetical protein
MVGDAQGAVSAHEDYGDEGLVTVILVADGSRGGDASLGDLEDLSDSVDAGIVFLADQGMATYHAWPDEVLLVGTGGRVEASVTYCNELGAGDFAAALP